MWYWTTFILFCSVSLVFGFPVNPGLFEGDIKLTDEQERAVKKAIDNYKKGISSFGLTNVYPPWKDGIVVYTYDASIGYRQRTAIEAAMNEWNTKTGGCISFRKRTNEKNYLEFHIGSGCWGHIGQPNGKSQISVGAGCEYQHVMSHEIGHALGFWHEQSRTDRDEYLQILWENVPAQYKEAFAKYGKDKIDSLGVPYDYTSIMHYPWNAFSTTGRDTVKPLKHVPNPGPYKYISNSDVEQAKRFYKCKSGPRVTNTPPPATKCVTEIVNAGYNANCRDSNHNCRNWASRGECRRNPSYMMKSCCRSCQGTSQGCYDTSTSCQSWASRGECKRNPGYMNLYCKKSCDVCEKKTRKRCFTLAPPTTTTSAPTTTEEIVVPPIPTDVTTLAPPIPPTDVPTPVPPIPPTDPPTKPKPPPTNDDCKQLTPLGIEASANVSDFMLSAMTSESKWHLPQFGRLNQAEDEESVGAWCAGIQDKNQYFEVALGEKTLLGGLKLQGRPSMVKTEYQKFVKKFELQYWNDYVANWVKIDFLFDGNVDGSSIKNIQFEVPITTTRIRVHPVEWQHMICLRLEIMKCS